MTSRKFEPLSKVSSGALCPVSESTADFKNNKKRSLDLISFKNKKNQQKQKTQKTMLRIPSVSLQCAEECLSAVNILQDGRELTCQRIKAHMRDSSCIFVF